MITLAFIIIFIILALNFDKGIRKNRIILYIIATILATVALMFNGKHPITEPFNQGYLGLGLLYIVMITGVLKNKTKLHKKLLGVRREYSIIGFIFVSSHAFKYLLEFLTGDISLDWYGTIAYVIMIPLFIMSFKLIRNKFKYKLWKNIQKLAYITYFLMFLHLVLEAKMPNLILYIVLFVPYIILKIIKEYKSYKLNKN